MDFGSGNLALGQLVEHHGDRAVARDVAGGTEAVDRDVGGDHQGNHVVVKAEVGGQKAGGCHDRTAGDARGGNHGDAQHEDEA